MELFDAVVAGAGPAGSILARTLSLEGLRVLLVEKETPGSRRVCGGFAGPETTDFFSSIGLSSQFGSFPKNAIRRVLISGPHTNTLETSFTRGFGWAVDRTLFDGWLAKEAVNEGAKLLTHSMVVSARRSASAWQIAVRENTATRRISARYYIITAGRRTPESVPHEKVFFACKTVYEKTTIPPDRVTLHFVKNGHIGLNPSGDGKVTLCLCVRSTYLRSSKGDLDQMMEELKRVNPCLADDLRGSKRAADWQTCVAEPDHKKIFYREGIFFAGDSLTMVDPIIGGGMSVAMASAEMLGTLLAKGAAQATAEKQIALDYKKMWSRRFSKRVGLAASLGRVERSGFLSEAMLFLLGCAPPVFSRLVHSTRKDPLPPKSVLC